MSRIQQTVLTETDYKDDVKFTAIISKGDRCSCDGCHRVSRVTKLIQPETKHFNGGELRTIYSSYWLCDSCLHKLMKAIELPKTEGR